MAIKQVKKVKKNAVVKANQVIRQARAQARESLKLLESLEKETLAKAKTLVKLPKFAPWGEFEKLQKRVALLEKQLAELRGETAEAAPVAEAEALPRT